MKKLLEKSRKIGFWTFDYLKGSPIKNHYKDISTILESPYSEDSIQKRNRHLNNVLEHAKEMVPFYKKNSNGLRLEDFPVINKSTVRNNYDSFKSIKFSESNNTPVVTSGSTGTPFKLFHDQNKRNRSTADIIYFAKQGGYEIGIKLVFMKVWNNVNKKSSLRNWMENIQPYSIFDYSDEHIKTMLQELREDNSEKGILCFASACDAIANHLDAIKAEPENFNVSSIITFADSLSKYTKNRMEYYFKVPVLSRYSNVECGMMAQQGKSSGDVFNFNWASFHIELLHPDRDEAVEPGEIGRVVITDFFNYCMPLIRYDTGDFAIMEPSKINGVPILKSIEGRMADSIKNTGGELITPHLINVNMWKYSDLRQYQFVQKGQKEYLFRLNPWDLPFRREKELLEEFSGYLGNDAIINIEYVEEIPSMSTGKRKYVVNEIGQLQ